MRYVHVCGESVTSVAAALVHLVACPREAYFRPDRPAAHVTPASRSLELTTWVRPRPASFLVTGTEPVPEMQIVRKR